MIRDILHRLRDRFPRKVLVWPVAVQGQNCAAEVAHAINGFNQFTPGGALPRPDLIIVARGGGSIEDLWGFNEEIVARAAAASQIPLISAVGHETDTTLIDYVSDLRAPTPTAAAEHAVPVRLELMAWADSMGARLTRGAGQAVQMRKQRLNDLSRALPRPETLLETPRQRLDRIVDRLPNALISGVQRRKIALSETAASLRPATLRALVDKRADHLRHLTSRLTTRPIERDVAQKQERLGRAGAAPPGGASGADRPAGAGAEGGVAAAGDPELQSHARARLCGGARGRPTGHQYRRGQSRRCAVDRIRRRQGRRGKRLRAIGKSREVRRQRRDQGRSSLPCVSRAS